MVQRILMVSILGMLAIGLCHAGDPASKELTKLEGTWTLVTMEINGKSLLRKDEPKMTFIIKRGKITSDAKEARGKGFELSKIIDVSKKPTSVTIPLEGSIKFYGIFEISNDDLRVCGDGVDTAQEKNPEGRRPKEFDSRKGLLLVFKRAKATAPEKTTAPRLDRFGDPLPAGSIARLGFWDVPAAKQNAADPPKNSDTEIKKLAQDRVHAAHKAYDVSLKLWKQLQPGVKQEDVYAWSVRWLNAQRDLSSKKKHHLSALSEHLKRMQELAQVARAFTKVGQGSPLYSPAADFYFREAEFWLAQTRANAKQADN